MPVLKTKPRRPVGVILSIPIEDIVPNTMQPRRQFDPEALQELADSIGRYGVLSPLTVRPLGSRWELIAGERRLRAARMAGLREVPCIQMDIGQVDSGTIALVENLQRRDLDWLEEARGIAKLIEDFGLNQEEVARRLGKSQPAVANKLRLLRLPEDVQERLLAAGLSERHGRALLRLPEDEVRRAALEVFIKRHLSVAEADRYVDGLLRQKEVLAPTQNTLFVMKDIQVFMNTLEHAVDLMQRGGMNVDVLRSQSEQEVTVTVRIRR